MICWRALPLISSMAALTVSAQAQDQAQDQLLSARQPWYSSRPGAWHPSTSAVWQPPATTAVWQPSTPAWQPAPACDSCVATTTTTTVYTYPSSTCTSTYVITTTEAYAAPAPATTTYVPEYPQTTTEPIIYTTPPSQITSTYVPPADVVYCSTIFETGPNLPTTAVGDCGTILIEEPSAAVRVSLPSPGWTKGLAAMLVLLYFA